MQKTTGISAEGHAIAKILHNTPQHTSRPSQHDTFLSSQQTKYAPIKARKKSHIHTEWTNNHEAGEDEERAREDSKEEHLFVGISQEMSAKGMVSAQKKPLNFHSYKRQCLLRKGGPVYSNVHTGEVDGVLTQLSERKASASSPERGDH